MLRQCPAEVLKDFHDCLQVRGILQQEEMKDIKNGRDKKLLSFRKNTRSDWHLFLDDLCFLCDTRRGGLTTTSIAVEQKPNKAIFWLSMNSGDLERTKKILEGILDTVRQSARKQENLTSNAVHDIFTKGVNRSPQRVANYASRLSSVLATTKRSQSTLECKFLHFLDRCLDYAKSTAGSHVAAVSECILRLREDHLAMCREAYSLSNVTAPKQFSQPRSAFPRQYNEVYRARHYIGRLSYWRKAARNVVSLGAKYLRVLENYEVSVIFPLETATSTHWALENEFDVLVGRVLPNFREQPIFLHISENLRRASRSTGMFKTQQINPRPHAEAVMLDYFFTKGLDFAMEDKYVACSKPSCYCCKLFFDNHPLQAVTGRHHGNLWIQWALPRPLTSAEGTPDRVSIKIVRSMSDQIQRDILSALLPSVPRQIDMFDSTTGLS